MSSEPCHACHAPIGPLAYLPAFLTTHQWITTILPPLPFERGLTTQTSAPVTHTVSPALSLGVFILLRRITFIDRGWRQHVRQTHCLSPLQLKLRMNGLSHFLRHPFGKQPLFQLPV
mmetsp:Transcript_2331/g.5299  ORF Transcript_2331/g.5299 Transcript_2331/m.5299 type:complete len:117 (-) Transcript_2331:1092-1442(-)